MNRKNNGHSATYLKRKAKNIKKTQGISYLEALNQASILAGFSNYKHFLNGNLTVAAPKLNTQRISTAKPYPLVLTYRTIGRVAKDKRPNAKMPISAHTKIATMLKGLRSAAEMYKRVSSPIRFVRGTLDDWIQCEFPDRNELTNEVFFRLYYGDYAKPAEYSSTDERKLEMISTCKKIKSILGQYYPDCKPLRDLYKKLDLAIKWISLWPAEKQSRTSIGIKRNIPPGTFVRLKNSKQRGVIIRHQFQTVDLYTDKGPLTAARHEVSVVRDQSKGLGFTPMRLFLPYGKWKCSDGKEVLFNRDYCPIWLRDSNGIVSPIAPNSWIKYDGEPEYFFDDNNAPWYGNKDCAKASLSMLEHWGVAKETSILMELLPVAIKAGDIGLLKPKNM